MKLHFLFQLAFVGLLTLDASAGPLPAQGVFILHGPNAKGLARRIERGLPKPLPSRLYNAGLLALADEAGHARILARINSARVLVLAGRGAAKQLGNGRLTVPVVALNTPASEFSTSRGAVLVWTENDAREDPRVELVSDLEEFTAPDPESETELAADGPFAPQLVVACVVAWIPELQRPVLIVNA